MTSTASSLQAFDVLQCPLNGRHLIEASAGTGKTYTLVNLYLRLLFEGGYLPEQVLVVTFTNAATQELVGRLRAKVRSFRQWLQGTASSQEEDPLFRHLQRQCDPLFLQAHALRVEQHFDQAPITTLHSFCQDSLSRYPLHSAQAFHWQLEQDFKPLMLECLSDFWRQHFYGEQANTPLLHLLLEKNITPEGLQTQFALAFENPDLQCIPEQDPPDLQALEAPLHALLHEATTLWQQESPAIKAAIDQAIATKNLNGNKYRQSTVNKARAFLDTHLSGTPEKPSDPALQVKQLGSDLKMLSYFTSQKLEDSISSKGQSIAHDHPFFALAQSLYDALEALSTAQHHACIAFYQQAIAYTRQQLQLRKAQAQVAGFQDLLTQMATALAENPAGDRLARRLHEAMPVALIDEFQDTDPWQFFIFNRIYAQGDLFLIGDPKQSIYRFRGADLRVYLQARESVPPAQRWTLTTNYRSQGAYIEALNAFFGFVQQNGQAPFGTDTIAYHPVTAHKKEPAPSGPSLYFWHPPGASENNTSQTASKKPDLERQLRQVVAQQVLTELEQGTPSGDIAILVAKHYQAEQLARELQKRRIPTLVMGKKNVFSSREAQDMMYFLEAVLNPREHLTTALSAYALGYTAADLENLRDAAHWVEHLEQCQKLAQRWRKYGFFALWSALVSHFELYPRCLRFDHGERAITNFRHLAHLVQEAALKEALSPEHTLLWLQRQIQDPHKTQEELLLHLESERGAVRLLTMHSSKGLEFPVVFCPYLWEDSTSPAKNKPVVIQSNAPDQSKTLLDMGSDQLAEHKEQAKQQNLEEQLRLSYVALTRAAQRCHVYIIEAKKASTSPLSHYFPPPQQQTLLQQLAAQHTGIAVKPYPALHRRRWSAAPKVKTEAQLLLPKAQVLSESFQNTSFTKISAQVDDESPVLLRTNAPEPTELAQQPLLAFPRGSESGLFLHHALEHLNPSLPVTQQSQVLTRSLQLYGIDAAWQEPLSEGLQQVLHATWGKHSPHPEHSLARLPVADRFTEWDFDVHLPAFHVEALASLYTQQGLSAPTGQAKRSYLTGAIDLVFVHEGRYWFADYKSNDLGNTLAAYTPEALEHVMQQHQYFLQLTLYTLALHAYLKQTLPHYRYEQHLGGAYYFFLRGMHPSLPGNGVYFYRPEAEHIEDLYQKWSAL